MDITNIAISKAKQSNCRYKISAIGFNKKGDFLGVASNRQRFNKFHGGLHAEINLINRYKRQLKTIVICRVGAKGQLLRIDPCENCQKVADKMGIKIISLEDNHGNN